MGRCLFEKLKEHHYSVHKVITSDHLGLHCCDVSACTIIFHETKVIAKHKKKITKEIIQAAEIVPKRKLY